MTLDSAGTERLHHCLGRLLPCVDREAVALTGSLAVELHVAAAGAGTLRDSIADVDVVATTVGGEFLISHFHSPHPGYPRFMVQLVDPASRTRIDIFADLLHAIRGAVTMDVAGHQMPARCHRPRRDARRASRSDSTVTPRQRGLWV